LSHYTGRRNLCAVPGRQFVIGKPHETRWWSPSCFRFLV